MDGMDKEGFLFSAVRNLDLIALTALPADHAGHPMEAGKKVAMQHGRVQDQGHGIASLQLLEVLAEGDLSSLAEMPLQFIAGFPLP